MSLKVEHDFQFLPRLAECEQERETEYEREATNESHAQTAL